MQFYSLLLLELSSFLFQSVSLSELAWTGSVLATCYRLQLVGQCHHCQLSQLTQSSSASSLYPYPCCCHCVYHPHHQMHPTSLNNAPHQSTYGNTAMHTLAFRFFPLEETAPLVSLDTLISWTFSYKALVNLSVLSSRKVLSSSVTVTIVT